MVSKAESFLSAGIAREEATLLRKEDSSISCCSDLTTIAQAMGQTKDWAKSLLIDRRGIVAEAHMSALGLRCVVEPGKHYQVSVDAGLVEVSASLASRDLEQCAREAESSSMLLPPHALVDAVWCYDKKVSCGSENILGTNVIFCVEGIGDNLFLPVIEPTSEALAYYGALLVNEGDVVQFPAPDKYPIWQMKIGKNYVDGYLMTDEGKGFYIEYHHDRPHWHQPLTEDAGGFYLLAKTVEETSSGGKTQYHLTGFRLSKGQAVYTRKGALHCDAGLHGQQWLVGYQDSAHCSTALIQNAQGHRIRLVEQMPNAGITHS